MSRFPTRGSVFTVRQIDGLPLRDTPHFGFDLEGNGIYTPVQTSHMEVKLSSLEKWKDAKFTFVKETDEWIPVFRFAGTREEMLELIEFVEQAPGTFGDKYLVSPKGYPFD